MFAVARGRGRTGRPRPARRRRRRAANATARSRRQRRAFGRDLRQRARRRAAGRRCARSRQTRAWRCAAPAAWASSTSRTGCARSAISSAPTSPPGRSRSSRTPGSMFSALLRTRRALGYTVAVSSGQELVTTTADYLGLRPRPHRDRVVALVLETVRDGPRLVAGAARAPPSATSRSCCCRSAARQLGSSLGDAHSGALAGARGVGGAGRGHRRAARRRPGRADRHPGAAGDRTSVRAARARHRHRPRLGRRAVAGRRPRATELGVPFAAHLGRHARSDRRRARRRSRRREPARPVGHRGRARGAVFACEPAGVRRRPGGLGRRARRRPGARSTTATRPTRTPCSTLRTDEAASSC